MPKCLHQVIATIEVESEQEIVYVCSGSGNERELKRIVSTGDQIIDGIVAGAVSLLIHTDNKFLGSTISKKQMEELKKIKVTLNERTLVHRFLLMRQKDGEKRNTIHYARYSLHY